MNLSRNKLREWRHALGVMAALGITCVAALAAAYQAGRERIAANAQAVLHRAVLSAAGESQLPADPQALAERFAALASERRDGPGWQVGPGIVVVPASGIGLWGPIHAVIGFDTATGNIAGIAFLSHQETPGLGARIEEEWFIRQFRGLRLPVAIAVPGMPRADHQFDAVTGATITSTAVRDLVNAAAAGMNPAPDSNSTLSREKP